MKKIVAIVLSVAVLLTMGLSVLSVSAADPIIFWTLDAPAGVGGGFNGINPATLAEGPYDADGITIDKIHGWLGLKAGMELERLKFVIDGTTKYMEKEDFETAEQAIVDACKPAQIIDGTYIRYKFNLDQAYSDGDHTISFYAVVDGEDVLIVTFEYGDGYAGGTDPAPSDPTETPTAKPDAGKDPTPPKTGDVSLIVIVAAAGIALTVLIKKKSMA